MKNSIIYKKYIFLFIFSFFLILLSYNYFVFDADLNHINSIYSSKEESNLFITGVYSSENAGVYNKIDETYYFSSGSFNMDSFKIISPYKVKYFVLSKDDNYYKLLVYSEKYYKEINIKILNIPIMSVSSVYKINSSFSFPTVQFNDNSSSVYTDVCVEFMENNAKKSFSLPALYTTGTIRFRGATSIMFEKKSYKLDLDNKVSFTGMDSDDDWILDAAYTDKSKIRNILSSQIWNLINDNQKIQNDLHGEFVELFVDNEYMGLYVLKEKVDKKTVGIDDGGLIAKSYTHVNDDIINDFISNNVSLYQHDGEMILENFELKKYNSKSLSNFIQSMRKNYIFHSYESIDESFYIENYLNYKLFISLIGAVDNVSKNQYYSMDGDDSKILITPWDMDLTFGLDYSSNLEIKSVHKFDNYNDSEWLNDYVLSNLDERTLYLLKERYLELRNGKLNMDSIDKILNEYKKNIIDSGSYLRDSLRWYEYDADYEIEYIRSWLKKRFDFLDEYLSI